MKERYFTKSKFSLSMECPTKLYYASKPNEYASTKSDDQFLKALAEGGFQIGQLAKCYYRDSNPIDLSDLSNDDAAYKTSELLLRDEVVIFEAVIIHNNLFLRADILVKKNNHFRIIEVKSSSANPNDQPVFMKKRGGILSDWLPYIHDIAFQKLVLQNAFENSTISAYLMLLDKTSTCPTDGLNQKFKISLDTNGRTKIIVSKSLSDEDLSRKLLREFNVDDEINYVYNVEKYKDGMSFDQYVSYIANMHVNSEKVYPIPGKVCAKCEFNSPDSNTLNGFRECWAEACNFKNSDFEKQSILDVWYYTKKDELIHNGIYRPIQLNENDINPKPDNKAGWSRSERQWLQVQKAQNNDQTDCLDKDGLSFKVDKWVYPLHFIDFETAMPAIPLNKDAPPYQPIAFQFSHHVLHQNGKIEHVDQFINNEIGVNPNINFVRTLMLSLNRDSGTIFRYHNHENTYLNFIYREIFNSKDHIEDKEALLDFIKSITQSPSDSIEKWTGDRCMVDLCYLVQRYYYDPATKGSTSIKKVFPAILQRSTFLRDKYTKPIYGATDGISSLNFKNMQWLQNKNGKIIDPYQLLPPLFTDIDITNKDIDLLFPDIEIKGGGAASIAYLRMQFSSMTPIEREALTNALLKYCELDTLAMVMIVEAWLDMLKQT